MCNHYKNDLRKLGEIDVFDEKKIRLTFDPPKPDVWPDGLGLVARLDETGTIVPDVMRWGFPPLNKPGAKVITNVRNLASPYWRQALKTEWRCLVPASSFAEYSFAPPKGERWFAHRDGSPMMFAGVWRPWTGARGTKANPIVGDHKLFAFLTCDPNSVVRPHHEKAMPVILPRDQWDAWLTGSVDEVLPLQCPAADDLLQLAGASEQA